MPAPDYTTEIAALRGALATGELTIESNGERVTYQSFADIRNRITYFEGLAAAAAGVAGRSSSSFGFSAVAFDRE
ncbi:phage head-tail joining protein [Caulobacter sp. UNC279MFTsu5.1]|uniref:phage head-tail joining protein n=1 Tax=Caulobacter sp. UNC279MFTsu5.1 TaxID=1502775 RepID=UPI000364126C|nr:hypothetical protein [Caulobacter sp. UNC279MFTsu5.1]SFK41828.1 hypothetical protein SAMN02799626_04242 [Caulobacter sp. UNC279MFTsu5.1]